MICYRCGQDVGDAKRCPNCGAKMDEPMEENKR